MFSCEWNLLPIQLSRRQPHVHGIILGNAVNLCWHTHTITAPSVSTQREVDLATWQEAGFGLETTVYIETHGRGAALGNSVEIKALTQAVGDVDASGNV